MFSLHVVRVVQYIYSEPDGPGIIILLASANNIHNAIALPSSPADLNQGRHAYIYTIFIFWVGMKEHMQPRLLVRIFLLQKRNKEMNRFHTTLDVPSQAWPDPPRAFLRMGQETLVYSSCTLCDYSCKPIRLQHCLTSRPGGR